MFKAVLLASAVAMCTAQPTKNIVELAESVPTLSTLVAAVKAGGLVDTLYVLVLLHPPITLSSPPPTHHALSTQKQPTVSVVARYPLCV
jgi:hypothetical protein